MTTVNVSAVSNTVVITENGSSTVVTAVTQGPQGPIGPAGASGLFVDDAAKVDNSIVYYNAASNSFKADTVWTTDTLVDGANF